MEPTAIRHQVLEEVQQVKAQAGGAQILSLGRLGAGAEKLTQRSSATPTANPRSATPTAKTIPGESTSRLLEAALTQFSHMFMPVKAALSLEARVAELEAERATRRERPATPEERKRWSEFLTSRENQALPPAQRAAVLDTWQLVLEREPTVMYPTAGTDDETGDFYFSWSRPERTLEVQVAPNGSVSWFFADHTTALSVSSDDNAPRGFLTLVNQFLRVR